MKFVILFSFLCVASCLRLSSNSPNGIKKKKKKVQSAESPNDITLVMLVVGSKGLENTIKFVEHAKGASSRHLDVHLVTDKLHAEAPEDWYQHLLSDMPQWAKEQKEKFDKITHGEGGMYMWKPFLYQILPATIDRALVLDTDLYLPRPESDLAELWDEFKKFPEQAVLGLALEQQPMYAPNPGFNGGVQLHYLARMRSKAYEQELQRCANGDCGDIGLLGDQTFYSKVYITTPSLFHVLSCGWNRQASFHMFEDKDYQSVHQCNDRCRMVHSNSPAFKNVITQLQSIDGGKRRATCAESKVAMPKTQVADHDSIAQQMIDCVCGSEAGTDQSF